MHTTCEVRSRIDTLPYGQPVWTSDFLDLGERGAIDKALSRLVKAGLLSRLARGVFAKLASTDQPSDVDQLVEKAVRGLCARQGTPVQVEGNEVLRRLGLNDSGGGCSVFLSSGPPRNFAICGRRVQIKRVTPRKVAMADRQAGLAVTALWQLDKEQATKERVSEIMEALPNQEQEALKAGISTLPGRISELLTSIDESKCLDHVASKDTAAEAAVANMDSIINLKRWGPSSVEGRWCGFGPYYAMFPVEFAKKVVEQYCPPGGKVIDPYCGRGTVPFVALASGRSSVACDINPVAWVYSKVKTDPWPDKDAILRRATEISESVVPSDIVCENEFQQYAWAQPVLGFLNSARRNLNWRESSLDRTLMGVLLVHLHAKIGDGLSNQLRQSKSMSPGYSVKWWKARDMRPPEIDVIEFLRAKLNWRYAKGTVRASIERPMILLQDARAAIAALPNEFGADLIFSSPPYCGVTNYRYDNWMRLWLLGEGPAIPNGSTKQRYANKSEYQKLLNQTFQSCAARSKANATVYIRTDARPFTLQATISALLAAWPEKQLFFANDKFKKPTQTALFGDDGIKPGEVDLLMLPEGRLCPDAFQEVSDEFISSLKLQSATAD